MPHRLQITRARAVQVLEDRAREREAMRWLRFSAEPPEVRAEIAKADRLAHQNRKVEARSKPFEAALAQWLDRVARVALRQELAAVGLVRKTLEDWDGMSEELRRLLLRFGVRQMQDATATTSRGDPRADHLLRPTLIDEVLEKKPINIKWFWEWTGGVDARARDITRGARVDVRERVRDLLREANQEYPKPSAGEVARRIRTQIAGEEGERIFTFSSERAALIARTELTQAENTGIMAGYEATGVEEVEWLAYRDGRSGDRHHERMHGVKVRVGERFELPSGAKLRYPGDPLAPIGETANCRCTVAPVRVRGPRSRFETRTEFPAPATTHAIEEAAAEHAAFDVGRKRTLRLTGNVTQTARSILGQPTSPSTLADMAGFPAGPSVTISALSSGEVSIATSAEAPAQVVKVGGRSFKITFAAPVGAKGEPPAQRIVVSEAGARSKLELSIDAAGSVSGDAPSDVLRAVQARVDGLPYTALDLIRKLRRASDGPVMRNEVFVGFPRGRGFGSRVFARQVSEGLRAGVRRIETHAARGADLNGYYTWARMGFDARLPEDLRSKFLGASTIRELMATAGGRLLWARMGDSFDGTFDLTPGSASLRALEAYLIEKKGTKKRLDVESSAEGRPPRGDQPPEMTPEDEAILDRIWDRIGREEGIRPPVLAVPAEELDRLWLELVASAVAAQGGAVIERSHRALPHWLAAAHQVRRERCTSDTERARVDAERELIERYAVQEDKR